MLADVTTPKNPPSCIRRPALVVGHSGNFFSTYASRYAPSASRLASNKHSVPFASKPMGSPGCGGVCSSSSGTSSGASRPRGWESEVMVVPRATMVTATKAQCWRRVIYQGAGTKKYTPEVTSAGLRERFWPQSGPTGLRERFSRLSSLLSVLLLLLGARCKSFLSRIRTQKSMKLRSGRRVKRLVVSAVDGKPCTEYRDAATKQKLQGYFSSPAHCPGFVAANGTCRCQPCTVCARRVCPDGPSAAPSMYTPNGVWVGVHCFPCFCAARPAFRHRYISVLIEPLAPRSSAVQ
jgi:hypothetical protein